MFSSSKMFDFSDIGKFRSCHIRPSEESTFSGSSNVEILIAVLAQPFEHTFWSVPVQRVAFRHFCFVQRVGTFMFLAIKDKNSGKSFVPLPSASTSLVMSCDSVRSCRVLTEGPHDSTRFLGGHRAVSTLSQVFCTTRVHDQDKRVLNLPPFSQMPPTMAVSYGHSTDEAKPVAPYSCVPAHDESIPRTLGP